MTRAVLLVLAMVALTGCGKDPVSTRTTTNADIDAELLFEVDGCRVYRFHDYGEAIYFARCGASVRTEWEVEHYNPATNTTTGRRYQTLTEED